MTERPLAAADRAAQLARLGQRWDLIVLGGGITGAGVFREAASRGLRVLLLEQGDFASGTSSRSSKLVHGGLRYLGTAQWRLTVHSVREREALLSQAAGLVERQGFVLPVWRGQRPGWWAFRAGLAIYDRIARKRLSRTLPWDALREMAPGLSTGALRGALYMEDARTDDARLVLRLIQEGRAAGGVALNYCGAERLQHDAGRVCGVHWRDRAGDGQGAAEATVVVNATGAWAAAHGGAQAPPLRPLRGSHLLFDAGRLPLPQGLSWLHPDDRRPVFAYPWQGVSLLGTTDLDHDEELSREPHISAAEVDYLLAAARRVWPRLGLCAADVIATYAGVRPVVSSGARRPSDESRESALWQSPGLVSVTGGKLTTFRLTALEALAACVDQGGLTLDLSPARRIFDAVAEPARPADVSAGHWQRLLGRYGARLGPLLAATDSALLQPFVGSQWLAAELVWGAAESVQRLDDLLLRRTRLGLVMGARLFAHEATLRALCQPTLGWDDARWAAEWQDYVSRWHSRYSLPEGSS